MKNAKNKPRVVIDTNVFVSAIVFGGKPRDLLDLLAEQAIVIVVAEELLTELRRVIITRFPDFAVDSERVARLLERDGDMVKLGALHVTVSRDYDDNKFIETAVLGRCNYIVSGDKDLLAIGEYRGIKILSPSEFLKPITD